MFRAARRQPASNHASRRAGQTDCSEAASERANIVAYTRVSAQRGRSDSELLLLHTGDVIRRCCSVTSYG